MPNNNHKDTFLVEASGFDGVITFRFLQLLTKPFTEWEAYKKGIIDENGKLLKKPKSRDEKNAYGIFERLVKNLKMMLMKVPGGKSKIGSYLAALFLLKEHYSLSDATCTQMTKYIIESLEEQDTEVIYPRENVSYMMIAKGKYELDDGTELVIRENQTPSHKFMGVPLYESNINTTNKTILFTYENIKEKF